MSIYSIDLFKIYRNKFAENINGYETNNFLVILDLMR